MTQEEYSQGLYERLELKKLVEDQYNEFFARYGSFKAIVDRIAGAVDIMELVEVVAKKVAEKAYNQGSVDKEKELAEKHQAEMKELKQNIEDILAVIGENVQKAKKVVEYHSTLFA